MGNGDRKYLTFAAPLAIKRSPIAQEKLSILRELLKLFPPWTARHHCDGIRRMGSRERRKPDRRLFGFVRLHRFLKFQYLCVSFFRVLIPTPAITN
jgi:hypothetical protein